MESSIIDLSKYRYDTAREDLEASKLLFHEGKYKPSINRSYYAIFHLLRAVTVLDSFDSKKHSGIISYFNKNYVKEGIFDKRASKIIDQAFRLREKADYQDFIIISKSETEKQIKSAEEIIQMLEPYLQKRWGVNP